MKDFYKQWIGLDGWMQTLVLPVKEKPPSKLHEELLNLKRQMIRTENTMSRWSEDFWASGGVCCPSCGVPGYAELEAKTERREIRIKQIEEKLEKDRRNEYE